MRHPGGGDQTIDASLWAGNPNGKAKAAQQSMHRRGHELQVGIALSRKIDLAGADMEAPEASVESMLQEPAMVSSSLEPTVWYENVDLKMHVGPGVNGMSVDTGSAPGGGAISRVGGGDRE
jgi:hypothetical protein